MPYTRIYVTDAAVRIWRFGTACTRLRTMLVIAFAGSSGIFLAQTPLLIQLPDMQITADKVIRGDGDTYGLGDWRCRFKASIEAQTVVVEGEIVFSENANDFSTIVGTARQRIKFAALEPCRHCRIVLDEPIGSVGGPNIGARGARWYKGKGLIRRAKMTTDTFGDDVGRVGGTIQFAPLQLKVYCNYALQHYFYESLGIVGAVLKK